MGLELGLALRMEKPDGGQALLRPQKRDIGLEAKGRILLDPRIDMSKSKRLRSTLLNIDCHIAVVNSVLLWNPKSTCRGKKLKTEYIPILLIFVGLAALEFAFTSFFRKPGQRGKYADDGVTKYKGNYGNLLFFWDVLLRSAKITRSYPAEIGVENLQPVRVAHQLLWPLVCDRSVREQHLPAAQEAAGASQRAANAA